MSKLYNMLEELKMIAKVIADMFGENCEVVIHDFSRIENSIIFIANSHVTGRNIGDALTDLGLKHLKSASTEDSLVNYRGKTKDGRILRSSSIIMRDDHGKPIGSLCINYDMTDVILQMSILDKNFFINKEQQNEENENFTTNINDLVDHLLNETIKIVGKPVNLMQKEDKLKAIKYLDDKGCFLIKKASDKVANFFNVSKFTIYNYIDEIRNYQ